MSLQKALRTIGLYAKSILQITKTNTDVGETLNPLWKGSDYSLFLLGSNANAFGVDGLMGPVTQQFAANTSVFGHNLGQVNVPLLQQAGADIATFTEQFAAQDYSASAEALNQANAKIGSWLKQLNNPTQDDPYADVKTSELCNEIVKMAEVFGAGVKRLDRDFSKK